ncbi:MAG: hypothetical protein R3B70_04530 [Polyangiaceae bacterium]
MALSFDPSGYTRAPKTTLPGAITLARALIKASPKSMPGSVKKELRRLEQRCERAEAGWTERHREMGAAEDESTRSVDGEADLAWALLRDRAVAYAGLPNEQFPRAGRAGEIVQSLFPDASLPFLRATYVDQLAAMAGILRRIDEDGLAKDIDALCGVEFLANVRAVMPRYEAMVLGVLARDAGRSEDLRGLLRELQTGIVSYATKVCATVDEDEPQSAETARVALLAIANLRAASARRGGRGGSEVETSNEHTGTGANANGEGTGAPN